MVAGLHGDLWTGWIGNPSVSFVVYDWVKRRLDHCPQGGGQKCDDRHRSYAYTDDMDVSVISVTRFVDLESHPGGSGQRGDERFGRRTAIPKLEWLVHFGSLDRDFPLLGY